MSACCHGATRLGSISFDERGSIHVIGLSKWGLTSLVVRDRVLPSGRPHEQGDTLGQRDSTWAIDNARFWEVCREQHGTNIDNTIEINGVLNELGQQLGYWERHDICLHAGVTCPPSTIQVL